MRQDVRHLTRNRDRLARWSSGAARPLAAIAAIAATAAGVAAATLAPLDAPPVNSASGEVLDRLGAAFTSGFAIDHLFDARPAVDLDGRAVTLVVAPFAGKADRIAGRVTLGGPLQSIDPLRRDRGVAAFTDHLTSQLDVRLTRPGARDDAGLVLAADNLATGFGLDRYSAVLVGERPARVTLVANAGYRIQERYKSPIRDSEAVLGVGGFGAPLPWLRGLRRAELGVAMSWLIRNHDRADLWCAGVRAEVPLADGLRLAIAVRHSPRPEMPGQDTTREVLTIAYCRDAGGF
jgi:hypothetical protein